MKLLTAVALMVAGAAHASTLTDISGSNFSFQQSSGLYWLDVGATSGLSFNDVTSGAWTSTGWRHATGAELGGLLSSYGLNGAGGSYDASYLGAVAGLTRDLGGITQTGQGATSVNGVYADIGNLRPTSLDQPPRTGHYVGSFGETSGWGFSSPQQYVIGDGSALEGLGHFLVNTQAVIAPVPEPSTYAMMGVGLLAVWGAARKKKGGGANAA